MGVSAGEMRDAHVNVAICDGTNVKARMWCSYEHVFDSCGFLEEFRPRLDEIDAFGMRTKKHKERNRICAMAVGTPF